MVYQKKITFITSSALSAIIFFFHSSSCTQPISETKSDSTQQQLWYGPNKYQMKPEDSLVRLGYDIIERTYAYYGPKGKIAAITNGMNCSNCHPSGGIVPWGNNFGAVIVSYPKFSYRSGAQLTLCGRINDCFERSLNGKAIDSNSHEMKAILAYMHWLADDITTKPAGSGIMKLKYLDRAADTTKGKLVFVTTCTRCHGSNGEGKPNDYGGFIYPPLWGDKSYNTGAGMCRLSMLSGFIKNNMPFDQASYNHPVLSDEQAWDVAAYVDSKPRPLIKNKKDYPDISKKEIDNPTGPYSDTFSEQQHKYGPFSPIAQTHASQNK